MPVKVVFLNVGQGDCTLMTFYEPGAAKAHAAVLLDCGSKPGGEVAPRESAGASATGDAKRRMTEHVKREIDKCLMDLKNPGVLDYLIISHPDEDHFNLLEEIFLDSEHQLRYSVKNVWHSMSSVDYKEERSEVRFVETLLDDPNSLASPDHSVESDPVLKPTQGDPEMLFPNLPGTPNLYHLNAGGALPSSRDSATRAKYVHSAKEKIANLNSLVFLVAGAPDGNGQRQKVLLMADALKVNEECLIKNDSNGLLKREKNLWLKVGHHGSKTSTCKAWLDYVTPDGLFVSTGKVIFAGKSATCTDSNFNAELLKNWEDVRTRHNIPEPKVTSQKKPLKRHWDYTYQNNTAALSGFVNRDATGKGVFSTFGGERFATGKATTEWTGRDWILWIDRTSDGSYKPGAYEISYQ
ncbi:ComEC/Rec2 family competence protein [Kitasatospora sp. NPDC048286]|uniref:ComEC/Rec2 family competence protein n=1 Tax=Kitasatospora sp. NPDC048286 TaxID=3364047 RepID=UPI003719B729